MSPEESKQDEAQAVDVDSQQEESQADDQQRAPSDTDSLRDELQEANDRVLRMQAELDNVRKRHARDGEQQRLYASFDLIRDLLPVLDNLQRAIESAEKNEESGGMLDGVKMVMKHMVATLAQHHCHEINALGEPFDPNYHEAILQQPSTEHAPGTVMGVTQTGYRLHDRVIRPSQVIVAASAQ